MANYHSIFLFTDGLKTETGTVSDTLSENLVFYLPLRLPNSSTECQMALKAFINWSYMVFGTSKVYEKFNECAVNHM